MVAVGLVLLVLAALLTLGTVFANGDPTHAKLFWVSLSNVSVGGLFLVGVITGVVGALGLSIMLAGLARKRRKSVQRKQEVRGARGQASTLEQENLRLQEELERTRSSARPAERPVSTPVTEETSLRKDLHGR